MTEPRDILPTDVLRAAEYIRDWSPDSAVFLGDFAVAMHALETNEWQSLARETHDIDVYISRADLVDLTDIEAVVPNRRLCKSQFIKHGVEVDVYTQNIADLVVSYDEIACMAEVRKGFRVAALEHLLVLKVVAWRDRRGSEKGQKDENDICAILLAMENHPIRVELLSRMPEEADLAKIVHQRNLETLLAGNSYIASHALRRVQPILRRIEEFQRQLREYPENEPPKP